MGQQQPPGWLGSEVEEHFTGTKGPISAESTWHGRAFAPLPALLGSTIFLSTSVLTPSERREAQKGGPELVARRPQSLGNHFQGQRRLAGRGTIY
jgi:hypothetical protein